MAKPRVAKPTPPSNLLFLIANQVALSEPVPILRFRTDCNAFRAARRRSSKTITQKYRNGCPSVLSILFYTMDTTKLMFG